jgi:hypothetical protein
MLSDLDTFHKNLKGMPWLKLWLPRRMQLWKKLRALTPLPVVTLPVEKKTWSCQDLKEKSRNL